MSADPYAALLSDAAEKNQALEEELRACKHLIRSMAVVWQRQEDGMWVGKRDAYPYGIQRFIAFEDADTLAAVLGEES